MSCLLHDERFNIADQVTDIGEPILVLSGSRDLNARGDLSGVRYTEFNTMGIIQQVSAKDVEVQEGILKPDDIEAYFNYDTIASGALFIGSFISGAYFDEDRVYEIKGVFRNEGHYRVIAAKL